MLVTRRFSMALLAGGALLAMGPHAGAQSSFPEREIRVVIPWNAGGSNDIMARYLQPILAEEGVNIVVENIGMR